MVGVNFNTGSQVNSDYGVGNVNNTKGSSETANVPSITASLDLPKGGVSLPAPSVEMNMSVISSLSEEALMTMLGMEERKDAVNSGVASIKAKAEERKEANAEKIQLLQEQAEKAREADLIGSIKKAFGILGAIIGTIASIATIVAGAITLNPLLIIGGTVGLISSVDSIVSTASDGKYSIANAIAESMKEAGCSETAAKWVGIAVSMAIGLLGAGLSAGGAFQVAGSLNQVMNVATKGINIANAVTQIGQGSVTIAQSVVNYDIANLQAESKKIEALLMRIQASSDIDKRLIELVLEKSQKVMEGVKDVVDKSNTALTSISTGGQAMA